MNKTAYERGNLYDLFWDGQFQYGKEEFRERLAKSLHDLTCSCADPDSEEEYLYAPTPGKRDLYQRRADALLDLIREQRPTDYGPIGPTDI